jgi:NTE family protein
MTTDFSPDSLLNSSGVPKKRALILGGGGCRGAFQVGKLKQLVEQGYRWDQITGVSVGAINAVFLGMFNKKDQDFGVAQLETLWKIKINGNCSIYEPWLPGPLTYVASLWKGSLFDTTPLRNLIESNVDTDKIKNSNVSISVGVCSLNSGKFKTVSGFHPNIIDYVMASSGFPIAFPTTEIDGEVFTDGGIRNAVPITNAIISGVEEIDIIVTNPVTQGLSIEKSSNLKSIVSKIFRTIDILSDEVLVSELHDLCSQHGIKLRIHAPDTFSTKHPLDFNPEHIAKLIDSGYSS